MIKETYCGSCRKWLGIDGSSFHFCPYCGSKFGGSNGYNYIEKIQIDRKNGIRKYYRYVEPI